MTTFESRWESLEPGRGFKRVEESHPLDFYIGIDGSGSRVLLLIQDSELYVPLQGQAINVLCRQRHDGRWALMFALLRPELRTLFSHLCEDLIESSHQISEKSAAGSFVLSRFDRWQRLLRSGSQGLLDESAQKGLLGELQFLLRVALPIYGGMTSLEGWSGPLDAEQDFRYPDKAFEIKTIGPETTRVKISSAGQLDNIDRPLRLVVVILDPSDRTDPEAFSLSGAVAEIRERLHFDPPALSFFNDRLLSAGYLDRDEYGVRFFKLNCFRYFDVREGFPRIMQSRISPAIGSVRYEIDIQACLPYEESNTGRELHGA